MDNLKQNTSPSGEADVTASQGQLDANETQPVNDASVVDGNESSETGQASNPWDNDPKFKGKTPEDIYKAYTEVEKTNGQLSQKAQLANLIQEKYGVSPEQLKSQIEQQEFAQQQQYYANNPLAPVLDKVNYLEQRLQQQEHEKAVSLVDKEVDTFIKGNPAYEKQRELIKELSLTPGIGFDPNTGENLNSLDDIAKKYFGDVRAQGQQDAYSKIEVKQQTQSTSSVSTPQKKFSLGDLKGMTSAEMAAILPHAKRSE